MDYEQKLEILRNRMFKLLCNKPYSANRNHVNHIADQIHYIENQRIKVSE